MRLLVLSHPCCNAMTKKDSTFTHLVWEWYAKHGRHNLPWRETKDPYCIIVSEIMLQQTQVDRVLPKYDAFLKQFPTCELLAQAPLATVLTLWQGLGYNRRAQYLHQCAKVVVEDYAGSFPANEATLRSLPGIGPYTAGAVLAFAFDQGVPIIETNIRTVFLHHYFATATKVSDQQILALVKRTLPTTNARDWYYALMDYGSYLKQTGYGHLHKSKQHKKQSTFLGSTRQLRGAIIRHLTVTPQASLEQLHTTLPLFSVNQCSTQLQKLVSEGLVVQSKKYYRLAT
jgi:A/G-specific adenine glycosylase